MGHKKIEVSFNGIGGEFIKVEVKKIKKCNGCDCWGRPEYDDVYIVTNKEGKIIYQTESDPTNLINELTK